MDVIEVDHTDFMAPSAFIFLYENQLFLTFKQRTVAVWNFRGELVTRCASRLTNLLASPRIILASPSSLVASPSGLLASPRISLLPHARATPVRDAL